MAAKRMAVERAAEDDELRVPLVEERLRIEKRMRSTGEAVFRRRVTEERRSAGIDVMREHLRVERRALAARPAVPSELAGAFSERTLRVPVFGETAVARKAPYVTGEVVVHRRRVTESSEVTETVMRERAEVEQLATPDQESTAAPVATLETPVAEATQEVAPPAQVPSAMAPAVPLRRVLDDVRTGWTRARRAA